MAIETAEDLTAMFHPDDFGVEMTAHMAAGSVSFNGIVTTGYVAEQPGMTAEVSMLVPRILARKASLPALAQGDIIEVDDDGTSVQVVNVQYKGDLIIIHYHEVY